jgi:TP901 family phage tail tape measure protein
LNQVKAASNSAASSIGQKFTSIGSKLTSVGKSLTRNVTLPIIGIGVAAGKMALDWNTAFAKISALSNASAKDVARWRKEVKELSKATGRSPQELADSLFFLASAGLKTSQVMQVLDGSANAASIGMGTTQDIAKLTAVALNNYAKSGLTATHAMDVLSVAIKEGSAEPAEFAKGLGSVLGIAAKAGVTFDQVAASVASLTNIGLNVPQAVTAIKGVLVALEAPGTQAAETLKKIGLSADDVRAAIADRGLLGALQMLDTRTGGNIDTMRKIIPNVRALVGQYGLLGENTDAVSKTFARASDSAGGFNEAMKKGVKDNPARELAKDMASLKVAAIELGGKLIPIAKQIADVLTGVADAFSKLSPAMQQSIVKWGLLAAAAGPFLRILGGIMRLGGGAIGVLTKLAGAAGGSTAAAAGGASLTGALAGAAGGAAGSGFFTGMAAEAPKHIGALASGAGRASAGALGVSAGVGLATAALVVKAAPNLPTTGVNPGDLRTKEISAWVAALNDGRMTVEQLATNVEGFNTGLAHLSSTTLPVTTKEVLALAKATDDGKLEGENLDAAAQAALHLQRQTLRGVAAQTQFGRSLKSVRGVTLEQRAALSAMSEQVSGNTKRLAAYLIATGHAAAAVRVMKQDVADAIDKNSGLGKSFETTGSRADGTAKHVAGYVSSLNRIPTEKRTKVEVNIDQAMANLRALRNLTVAIPDTIHISTSASGPHSAQLADYGARIKGPANVRIGNITEDVLFVPRTGPGARRGGDGGSAGQVSIHVDANGSWFAGGMQGAREFLGHLKAAAREDGVLMPGFS